MRESVRMEIEQLLTELDELYEYYSETVAEYGASAFYGGTDKCDAMQIGREYAEPIQRRREEVYKRLRQLGWEPEKIVKEYTIIVDDDDFELPF